MPMIVYGAVEDLKKKGVSISVLGDTEATDIKVFLRTVEYDEFLSRFYQNVDERELKHNTKVEVFSKSADKWCEGTVTFVDDKEAGSRSSTVVQQASARKRS